MFSRYAALVKNLRGVLHFHPADNIRDIINWLIKKFKYRNLGISPTLINVIRDLKGTDSKPFVELVYPVDEIKEFAEFLSIELKIEKELSESIVLASVYVSPVLLIGTHAYNSLIKIASDSVYSRLKLDDKLWKLHLRIADYSVLDLYNWSTSHAERLWKRANYSRFIAERRDRIISDKRRYWRLQKGECQEWPFIIYVDLAQLLATRLSENANFLELLMRYSKRIVSASLAIQACVNLQEKYLA